MQEEKILPVEEIIEKAKNLGVRFGQGEPYNRLRYYTKLNWIPHMERKGKNVQGHSRSIKTKWRRSYSLTLR